MPIEFVGFTGDSRIVGQVPLADDRLSDMLNSVARIVVRGAAVEEIDLAATEHLDATVAVGDFLVVAGTGRRGLESRRKRTLTRRVRIGLGRYIVTGDLHIPLPEPDDALVAHPSTLLEGRDLLIALTDARITYDRRGKPFVERWDTLLVNRARANWIEATDPAHGDDTEVVQRRAPRYHAHVAPSVVD